MKKNKKQINIRFNEWFNNYILLIIFLVNYINNYLLIKLKVLGPKLCNAGAAQMLVGKNVSLEW